LNKLVNQTYENLGVAQKVSLFMQQGVEQFSSVSRHWKRHATGATVGFTIDL